MFMEGYIQYCPVEMFSTLLPTAHLWHHRECQAQRWWGLPGLTDGYGQWTDDDSTPALKITHITVKVNTGNGFLKCTTGDKYHDTYSRRKHEK